LAEVEATVRKAARGHGCPWGLAEEAGKAARWLVSHELPGETVMAAMLSDRAECCCRSGAPCAIKQATALADTASNLTAPVTVASEHPLLVLAQMGRAVDGLGTGVALEWEAACARLGPSSLAIEASGDLRQAADTMTCQPDTPEQGVPPSPASRAVDSTAWATLDTLAKRILVPASDASRAGAGAGNSDND
jgi:hypothetical protein